MSKEEPTDDWRTQPMKVPEAPLKRPTTFTGRPVETVHAESEPPVTVKDVLQSRGNRYGKFIDNATIAQHLKRFIRSCPGWDTLDYDQREALDNISIKESRILSKGTDPTYMDNWTDIAGYATLVVDRRS